MTPAAARRSLRSNSTTPSWNVVCVRKAQQCVDIESASAKHHAHDETCVSVLTRLKYLTDAVQRLHIERGLVRVNEETMDMDYVLKGNDVVVSERHCHEACVPDEAVQVWAAPS